MPRLPRVRMRRANLVIDMLHWLATLPLEGVGFAALWIALMIYLRPDAADRLAERVERWTYQRITQPVCETLRVVGEALVAWLDRRVPEEGEKR